MKPLGILLCVLLLSFSVVAQDESSDQIEPPRVPPPVVRSMQVPIKLTRHSVVREGTIVPVRVVSPIKAKEAQVGDNVDLVLDHDLWVGDLLVAKQGSPVQATLVEAAHAKWGSRGSKLAIEISDLHMLNGQLLPLRATMEARGSIGPTAAISGGVVADTFLKCPLCAVVFAPAALVPLVSTAAPGTNKNIKANTLATAFVDRDIVINIPEFRKLQAKDPEAPASLAVVRGSYGSWSDRNLYCNGIPMAHMPSHRRLELKVQPGWYRFAIDPKQPTLEIFLGPASETNLITDYQRVYIVNEFGSDAKLAPRGRFEPDRSVNTQSIFGGKKNEDEYLRSAKPIDEKEVFTRECPPLAVQTASP